MGRKILRRIDKDIETKIRNAGKIIFFLDYDGTLTPIRKKPELAVSDKDTRSVLRRISSQKWAKVFIVSGRSMKNVRSMLAVRTLYYAGNHGIELEGPGLFYVNPQARKIRPIIRNLWSELKKDIKIKGVIVENKGYTLSVHYRMAGSKNIPIVRSFVEDALEREGRRKYLVMTGGKKVFEIRPKVPWNKGKIVQWVLKREKNRGILAIGIGDDKTDEDIFRAIGKRGLTLLVAQKAQRTRARYRLGSVRRSIMFLESVLKIRNEKKKERNVKR